jgi:hypothetical protein
MLILHPLLATPPRTLCHPSDISKDSIRTVAPLPASPPPTLAILKGLCDACFVRTERKIRILLQTPILIFCRRPARESGDAIAADDEWFPCRGLVVALVLYRSNNDR